MKKYLLPAVISVLFLSSCALIQKEEFAQRKYYNFPRTEHAINAKQIDRIPAADKTTAAAATAAAEPEADRNEISVGQPPVLIAGLNKHPLPVKHTLPAVVKNRIAPVVEEINTVSEPPVIAANRADAIEFSKKKVFDPFFGAGASFVIQVLAAIFLPPIGVYLHNNGRTNVWFWVTLCLCIGALVGFAFIDFALAGPGLWFVAAVLALLSVFDVLG